MSIAIIGTSLPRIFKNRNVVFFDSSAPNLHTQNFSTFDQIFIVDDVTVLMKAGVFFDNVKTYFVFWCGNVRVKYHDSPVDYAGAALLNNFEKLFTAICVKDNDMRQVVEDVYHDFIDTRSVNTISTILDLPAECQI
jgi:hypothetical protein